MAEQAEQEINRLERRDTLNEAIRIGIVSSIDSEHGTAQVTFEDRDDIVTRDLPMVVPCTLYDRWYYMPDIGERVRVLMDPDAPTRGCILGSYYDDVRMPPIDDEDKVYVIFKDETLVEYDRKLHKLTIKIPEGGEKSIDVFAESDINVKTNGYLNVKAAKDINIETAQNINITVAENTTINTGENTTINTSEDTTINTGGKTNIISGDDISISTAKNINETAQKTININAKLPITISSDEYVVLRGAKDELIVP